ncbi:hypothetical protein PSMK_05770 [Phycisphaera mikurensis NBRC 102666]|uniref:Uncharacterized protein n=1 Tax=Phycisphaera mikurensis (strain NBRC 102666 / KCTC 22515 / FYK2301M01) TaxID=1142394 RepID=I0IBU8_PHYMF|nr:hypothetical protein PSMK_05770 [Phycisphaera mikurensis NBRC 102666]
MRRAGHGRIEATVATGGLREKRGASNRVGLDQRGVQSRRQAASGIGIAFGRHRAPSRLGGPPGSASVCPERKTEAGPRRAGFVDGSGRRPRPPPAQKFSAAVPASS